MKQTSEYEQQAIDFLKKHVISLRITLSDTKPAPWDEQSAFRHHYRCTLSRPDKRVTFDFWGSVNDAEQGKHPGKYDVLACISGDVYCPESFVEFCTEYGYEQDSIKALQTFRRCDRFARRLRAFFTKEEQEALSEID